MSQEDKNKQNLTEELENEVQKSNHININKNDNSKNEIIAKIIEMNTKFLDTKNNFMEKVNKFVSDISQNYDKFLSDLNKSSTDMTNDPSKNEENLNHYLSKLENALERIEELQNNILEKNDNLNNYLIPNDLEKNKKKKDKEKVLKINCNSDIIECQRKIEPSNLVNIEKIIIKELSSNILEEIFLNNKNNNDNEEIKEDNENKKYNDIIIKKCNLENVNFSRLFPNLNKFKLKKCQISFDSIGVFNFNNIKELYLESIGLVNESFNSILSDFKNNINFINNIKMLSIKNNNISIFNLNFKDNNITNTKYNNLEFLNLSNNKIGKLKTNIFDLLPTIKLIDLTNNNISFNSRYKQLLEISKNKSMLILLAKNPGVVKEKNREEYCNYLKDIIPTLSDNPAKSLNVEGIFCGKTYPLLSEINISLMNLNLIILNLSYNNLNDQDLIKLLENNNKFCDIKKLILCSNYLTEAGIENLINGEYTKVFTNLKKLDLSGNPIKISNLTIFKKFIIGFPKIKTLIIRHTPIEKDFNNYLKVRVARKIEENEKKELSNMSDMDLQYEEFVEKEHFLKEKTKITLKLMNTIGYKNLSLVRKYFPYLLDNIKIETKFIYEDRINKAFI